MDKLVKNVKSWGTPRSSEELSKSQYSLVSTDLTDGAVQLWFGLPDEVKYDPALSQFRHHYEKEHGGQRSKIKRDPGSIDPSRRLPCVNSAPHLNNNTVIKKEEVSFLNGKDSCSGGGEKQEKLIEDELPPPKKKSKAAQASHCVKLTILVMCWIFFTVIFLMYNEKETIVRHSSVAPGEVKSYAINSELEDLSILLKFTGPFVSEQNEKKINDTTDMPKMKVWIERWAVKNSDKGAQQQAGLTLQSSDTWSIILDPEDRIDFTQGETRSTILTLESTEPRRRASESNHTMFAIRMMTNANTTTPFTFTYTVDPLQLKEGVIYACILLCALYVLIIFEAINRTMAAVLVSTTSIAVLALVGERPSLPELISWLDVETLLLLFSMMVLVAIIAETGLFDYLAVFTFEVTKGKIWPLITLLSVITAFISTFLDNVTTVLLMTPVTIRLCEVMDLDPIPVLMSMVLFSNIGGTMTPVGDPPNVIIASNKQVVQSGVNFTNFTLHMSFGILVVCVQTYFQLRYIFRDPKKLRLNEPRDIKDLRHQISIWRRAADSLPYLSKDEIIVKERLERKIRKLNVKLEALIKESKTRACPKACFQSMLSEMKGKYMIKDKVLLVKCSVAIIFVVLVFFLHSIPEFNRVSLGWTALLGALLLLVLADREDLEPILHRIEWSTLLFFAALFVLMESLSKLGLIEFIGGITEGLIMQVDESARLAVAILLMLWVSGITSAFVDNIPLTTMMVRIVTSLGNNPTLNLPMTPLIWALSFGACLGGNGTLIGASANVVCAGVAEQHGYKFTFMQFFKIGFPVMIGHLIVASFYLLLCHCLLEWH
ncbi:P protein-like isoform X2 [Trichoplusia ni]|uniref:P protein-like isoform X2 n=1 Tax=Trichoplusia ni TaxID=7111 RepID=A0A7E5W0X2_TRINI|nr:P protein-like isoform X2 [Trichoplusia ni]